MKANATSAGALDARIRSQAKQSIDLNRWIFERLNVSETASVLELCCGTGAQTRLFSEQLRSGNLTCVDISQDALELNARKVGSPSVKYICAALDELPAMLEGSFDLIFCAYGFYYSADPTRLFSSLIRRLNPDGRFVLVGPVLGNNAELYRVVRALGVSIPDAVSYSSEEFLMEFLRLFLGSFAKARFERTMNSIRYENCEDLLEYWRNTTFYVENRDSEFLKHCNRLYGQGPVVVNKSIGFLEGHIVSGDAREPTGRMQ